MLKRIVKFVLEAFAVLVAGLAVLLVLAAVRLSYGPVALDFMTPYVEDGLSADDGSYTVDIRRTVLTWAGWERTLDVRLSGVSVSGADGVEKAFVPELVAAFSLRALLDGRLAPRRLDLFGPRLRIVRLPDGKLTVGEGAPSNLPSDSTPPSSPQETAPDTARERAKLGGDVVAEVVSELAEADGHAGPLGYLQSVNLLNVDFAFEDRKEAITLRAPGSDIMLSRDDGGLGINARLNVNTGASSARIRVAGSYSAASELADLEVRLNDLEPAAFAPLAPVFRPLEGVHLPVSGTVMVRGRVDGTVESLALDLRARPGSVRLPGLYDDPVNVTGARLEARLTAGLSDLVIEAFTAEFDGPRIALSGTGSRDGQGLSLALDLGARDVTPADLKRLWPKGVAGGGRDWVLENVEKGGVSQFRGSAALSAAKTENGLGPVTVAKFDATFDFAGLDIHFLRPLPPITNVTGKARLDATSITFDVTGGRLGGLRVRKGTIRALGLDKPDQQMEIEAVVAGPVADAVGLLSHPRLDLIKGLGIEPAGVKGQAATRLRLRFPLDKDLTFDAMEIAAASNIRGAEVPKIALGNDLTRGHLTLQLDKRGMDLEGTASVAGTPVELKWTENFTGEALYQSRYYVKGTADDAVRGKFGLGFLAPYVQGPVATELIVTRYGERTVLAAGLDLGKTTLDVAELGWHKAADVAGIARFNLTVEKDTPRAIDNIAVRAGNLTAAGRLAFTGDGQSVSGFEFSELRFGENDLRVSGSLRPDGGVDLSLAGRRADIRAFLDQRGGDGPLTPLDIKVDLDSVRAAPDAVISNVRGRLVRDVSDWQDVNVQGTVGDGKPLAMKIWREGSRRMLHVTSADAGAALKAVDVTENMVGGTLNIEGNYDDTKPESPLTGHLAVRDFRLVRAPFLAKILSVASLTGLFDALSGQGISFSRADVPFVMTGDKVVLKDARAYGSAIGFTTEGALDLARDTMNLRGTVVPAYSLNSVFADIPILGRILVPEKGSGLFAATYRATGAIENPEVSVNPLATLTPGFLRGLFNIFDSPAQDGATDAPPADGKKSRPPAVPPGQPVP